MIVKKDGTKELYDRDKLKRSIMLACAKRTKISIEDVYNMIGNLEISWLEQGNEITSYQIGDDVMMQLKNLDFVAYMRFSSVYKKFESKEDFILLLE